MPAIVFGTDQLPDGFGNRLSSFCVKLCHVRDSSSFSPKLSRYEMVPAILIKFESVDGPSLARVAAGSMTAAMPLIWPLC
ncbi:hypothetical protein [Mesorhizobium onobrychidis]|uniref:Uncharacterized protein n=1 Tax=Mesorhizobium onobrychidis TaxID=2775404 RepID=A0ABY5QRF7_9HYPH|nr:hypothetical protein [Mesorhizobium onobrychidis]UVC13598.1 hypothetical protein IHQ72_23155 [Mesorhizobium onobrychidis]